MTTAERLRIAVVYYSARGNVQGLLRVGAEPAASVASGFGCATSRS
jgi:hypothetical protein